MRARLLVPVLFLSASVLATAAMAATLPAMTAATTTSPTDNPALLKELAERLLVPLYYGPPGSPAMSATLYPGKLPYDFALTLPQGARLVGSVVRSGGMGGKMPGPSTEVVLDMSGSTSDAVAALREFLNKDGWSNPNVPYGAPRGFQPTMQPTSFPLCKGSAWLNVMVSGGSAGVRDVRLTVNSPGGPCTAQPMPMPVPVGMQLLPALYGPSDLALTTSGMSGGPNRWGSEAVAETRKAAHDLEALFAAQLEKAGWSRLSSRADGPIAWSMWRVPASEGNWTGFLFVLESSSKLRELSVRVMSDSAVPSYPTKCCG